MRLVGGDRGLGPPWLEIPFETKRPLGQIVSLEQGGVWGYSEKEVFMFEGNLKMRQIGGRFGVRRGAENCKEGC